MLMKMSDPEKKKIILVTERGEPVAVAGLRNRWGHWEPVTQWIVPGVLFPVKEGYIDRVLGALGLAIHIAWWRWNSQPPRNQWVTNLKSTSTHRIRCSDDFEHYWRKDDFFKNIRNYRNRCRDFRLKVDLPGAREWTVRMAEAKWRRDGISETPDLFEKLVVTEYLERRGLCHTLSLMDQNELIAGIIFLSHRNDAVAQTNYRNPEYNRHGVMTRLMDLSFSWAREMGFEKIDIGGSFDYKNKWAPEEGEKWEFDVSPRNIMLEKKASHLVMKVKNRLNRSIKKFGSNDNMHS